MEILVELMNTEIPLSTKIKNMLKCIVLLLALCYLYICIRETSVLYFEMKQEKLEDLNAIAVAGAAADMIDSMEYFRLPKNAANLDVKEKVLPPVYVKTEKDKKVNDKAEIDKITTGQTETDDIEKDNIVINDDVAEEVLPENPVTEISGFLINDSGYITGYADGSLLLRDGLLILPSDESCIGVESNAFAGLEDEIIELYIPANINYISPEAFDQMSHLIYIEAASGNNSYYSEDGILYYGDGSVAVYPKGR